MTAPAAARDDGFRADRARRSRRSVVVFDLGGTWFRAGVLRADGTVTVLRRDPALGVRTRPGPVSAVQDGIIDWLTDTLDAILREGAAEPAAGPGDPPGPPLCAVSLGAAMNGATGEVRGSAPLFGSATTSWWPAAELAARRPDVRWSVVNDVSALAYALLTDPAVPAHGRAAALTVSTGIAYRTIEPATGRIPLDARHGLQGEIGHLPSRLEWQGVPLSARCDCGALDHVAAYSSGSGIAGLLRRLPAAAWGGPDDGAGHRGTRPDPGAPPAPDDTRPAPAEARLTRVFGARVAAGHPGALRLLDAVTRPLAEVLTTQAALDPEVTPTVLTGGVVDGLGDAYLRSLLRNLARTGLYGITDRDPDHFAGRIVRGRPDGLGALRGAGVHARGLPNERVHTA
ncbi:ROK family protein [Streptomyces sp. NPDC085479]|uniref:ROK family protein n=1 Tax=Streptomyces sp. NPDC085479 TaxID=3365726 RepID=UPI0037D6E143